MVVPPVLRRATRRGLAVEYAIGFAAGVLFVVVAGAVLCVWAEEE